MTETELFAGVQLLPEVTALGLDAGTLTKAIEHFIPIGVNQVLYEWRWPFSINDASTTSVADTATYTLEGDDSDALDILTVRYDGMWIEPIDFVELEKWRSNQTISQVLRWYHDGRSGSGYPKITFVATPAQTGKTIDYWYRKKGLEIHDFPSELSYVMIYAVAKWLVPALERLYDKHLAKAIADIKISGGESHRALLDPVTVTKNRLRAGLQGYSGWSSRYPYPYRCSDD